MRLLTVFYDGGCAFCVRCRDWLMKQEQAIRIAFVEKTWLSLRHPDLAGHPAGSELVAVADTGEVWVGDSAFVVILFALERYRKWSEPGLQPYARAFFSVISNQRHRLSTLLGGADRTEFESAVFAADPSDACSTDSCSAKEVSR